MLTGSTSIVSRCRADFFSQPHALAVVPAQIGIVENELLQLAQLLRQLPELRLSAARNGEWRIRKSSQASVAIGSLECTLPQSSIPPPAGCGGAGPAPCESRDLASPARERLLGDVIAQRAIRLELRVVEELIRRRSRAGRQGSCACSSAPAPARCRSASSSCRSASSGRLWTLGISNAADGAVRLAAARLPGRA